VLLGVQCHSARAGPGTPVRAPVPTTARSGSKPPGQCRRSPAWTGSGPLIDRVAAAGLPVQLRDRVQAVVLAYETGLASPRQHRDAGSEAGQPGARGTSSRRITILVGERRTTSRKPAFWYRLREPKNMKSSWLRCGLSTG
jgi:hypothetical protein